jgi:hypothetical protein
MGDLAELRSIMNCLQTLNARRARISLSPVRCPLALIGPITVEISRSHK